MWSRSTLVLSLILCICNCNFTHNEDGTVDVNLAQGDIRGEVKKSYKNNEFVAVKNIPYAQPPLGYLRWMPPEPAGAWSGLRNGRVDAPLCTQGTPDGSVIGQEDCLRLNVYTPIPQTETHLLPVMVWIHGGGFIAGGSAQYGPEFLMDYDVVIVTINYRLGMLGFLSLDYPLVSGNQGLMDQVMALHWVKDNIKRFSGDPEKVTIFGESAGSWSVFHQMLNPHASGLFRAAIGESGTMIGQIGSTYTTRAEAKANGQLLAKTVGCWYGEGWPIDEVEICLREINNHQIVVAEREMGTQDIKANIDSFSNHGSILPQAPEYLLAAGKFNQVPVLIGHNSAEGSTFSKEFIEDPDLLLAFNDPEVWDSFGPAILFERNPNQEGSDFGPCDIQFARTAKDFYIGNQFSQDSLDPYVQLISDSFFGHGIHTMVNYLSPLVPTYQYVMRFQDATSFMFTPEARGTGLGVGHGDEVFFLFKFSDLEDYYDLWSGENVITSRRMCEMWTNFAKELKPSLGVISSGDLGGVEWEPVNLSESRYLFIDTELEMGRWTEFEDRMLFWDHTLEAGC